MTEHWEREAATPTACTWSASSRYLGARTASRATAARSASCDSDVEAESDGRQPILVAGEEAGATLPFGCRMGICHTCVGRLCSGKIRDLRTGEVHGQDGEMVRTCVNAPEGAIEIEL